MIIMITAQEVFYIRDWNCWLQPHSPTPQKQYNNITSSCVAAAHAIDTSEKGAHSFFSFANHYSR